MNIGTLSVNKDGKNLEEAEGFFSFVSTFLSLILSCSFGSTPDCLVFIFGSLGNVHRLPEMPDEEVKVHCR